MCVTITFIGIYCSLYIHAHLHISFGFSAEMVGTPTNNILIAVTSVISSFGICFILFFLGLILFSKNNKTIDGYFFAVASNSIFDLTFSIMTLTAKLDCFCKDGFFVFTINRFDHELDPFVINAIMLTWIFTAHTCFYVVPIPFYIRYSLICKRQNVSYAMRVLLYLFIVVYEIIICSLFSAAFRPSPSELVSMQMKPYLRGNEEGKYWNIFATRIVSSETTFVYISTGNNFNVSVFTIFRDWCC